MNTGLKLKKKLIFLKTYTPKSVKIQPKKYLCKPRTCYTYACCDGFDI